VRSASAFVGITLEELCSIVVVFVEDHPYEYMSVTDPGFFWKSV